MIPASFKPAESGKAGRARDGLAVNPAFTFTSILWLQS